jgi:hypothetical protein
MISAILYLIIKVVILYLKAKNAVHGAWFNTKFCGEKRCLPTPDQLKENLPTTIGFDNWDTKIAKYCSVIIYSIEKASQEKIKPVYPKDLVMEKELYDNAGDPVFGVVFTNSNNKF